MEQKKAIRTRDGFRVTHINRRRACRLACVECQGWSDSDREVRECDGKMLDGTTCALVDFKKMTGPQSAAKRSKATKLFCLECMGGNSSFISQCSSVYCPMYPYRNTRTDKSTLFNIDMPDEMVLRMTKEWQRELL
jgi:hypothetical protein